MKYIRHKTLGFVVFNEQNIHAEMARALGRAADIASAGFCHKQPDGSLVCYGESVSLGIKSGETDTRDLNISME